MHASDSTMNSVALPLKETIATNEKCKKHKINEKYIKKNNNGINK